MDEDEARRALVETCARLYDRGLTVSAGGNMSVRCGDCVLITPSGRNKGLLAPGDLVKVAMDGTVVSGPKPSIETGFHLALYNENPGTNAVVHCHPLYGVALTVNGKKLRCNLTPEGALLLGRVAEIPYITPGTPELVEAVRANAASPVMIMDRHGTLAQGRTLEEAYNRIEELEFQARLQMLCPDAEDLPDVELERLGVLRWRCSWRSGSAASSWTRGPTGSWTRGSCRGTRSGPPRSWHRCSAAACWTRRGSSRRAWRGCASPSAGSPPWASRCSTTRPTSGPRTTGSTTRSCTRPCWASESSERPSPCPGTGAWSRPSGAWTTRLPRSTSTASASTSGTGCTSRSSPTTPATRGTPGWWRGSGTASR